MPRATSDFPHADIEDKGPPVTAVLSASRDSADYRNPGDHDVTGLFVGGPQGEHSALSHLIGYTFCAVSAASPEGERRRQVVTKGRVAESRMVTNGGGFFRPAKPANSGRKRKAA